MIMQWFNKQGKAILLTEEEVAIVADCAVKADQNFADHSYNPYPLIDSDYIK